MTATAVVVLGATLGACGAATVEPPPPPAAINPAPEGGKTLVIAELGDDASKKIKRFQPLADHLATALASQGYVAGEVRIVHGMD